MKRILVIRGGAIGDFVLTLPAIRLLRESFPQARLEILGNKYIVSLAEGRFYAQAVRSIESASLASFFVTNAESPNDLCDYFRSFDLVVSYLFDPERVFECNLARAGVKNFLACSAKVGEGEHAAEQLARPLKQLGLSLVDSSTQLFPSSIDLESAQKFLQRCSPPIFALHPGSGSKRKNWPLDRWLQLSEWLHRAGHAASRLIVGGEADEKELDALCLDSPAGKTILRVENLPLPLLAAVLQQCALFIGHDSGISHIAAAVGRPCLLLYGPTDPSIWAPTNENVRVLRAPNRDLAALTLEEVKETISSQLLLPPLSITLSAVPRAAILRADAHRHQDVEERSLNL